MCTISGNAGDAVAVSLADLAVELRVIGSAEEDVPAGQAAGLERLLTYATEEIEQLAPSAPEAVKDVALVRAASYLHESPAGPIGAPFADFMLNSGAAAILSRYIERRATAI